MKEQEKRKVLIAGGTGMIGQEIVEQLQEKGGYEIALLSRKGDKNSNPITYVWDPQKQYIEDGALDDVFTIINLSGAGIADKLWTKSRKELLIESRTSGIETIRQQLQKRGQKLPNYISTSAIGYYGDVGEKQSVESDLPVDDGFLSTCCVAWEKAAHDLSAHVEKTCIVRVGVVLDKDKGALSKIALPMKFGSAAYFGQGNQYFPWIHKNDVASIYIHLLEQQLAGTYNAVAPESVSIKEFTKKLKKARRSKAVVHSIPAFLIKLGMGELSTVLLNSNHVSANKIINTDFQFAFPDVTSALKDIYKAEAGNE